MTDKAKRMLHKPIFSVFQQKLLFNILRREQVLNFGYDNKLAPVSSSADHAYLYQL